MPPRFAPELTKALFDRLTKAVNRDLNTRKRQTPPNMAHLRRRAKHIDGQEPGSDSVWSEGR
jgi:hypothetical protein